LGASELIFQFLCAFWLASISVGGSTAFKFHLTAVKFSQLPRLNRFRAELTTIFEASINKLNMYYVMPYLKPVELRLFKKLSPRSSSLSKRALGSPQWCANFFLLYKVMVCQSLSPKVDKSVSLLFAYSLAN
jgi:hypothetical protein